MKIAILCKPKYPEPLKTEFQNNMAYSSLKSDGYVHIHCDDLYLVTSVIDIDENMMTLIAIVDIETGKVLYETERFNHEILSILKYSNDNKVSVRQQIWH